MQIKTNNNNTYYIKHNNDIVFKSNTENKEKSQIQIKSTTTTKNQTENKIIRSVKNFINKIKLRKTNKIVENKTEKEIIVIGKKNTENYKKLENLLNKIYEKFPELISTKTQSEDTLNSIIEKLELIKEENCYKKLSIREKRIANLAIILSNIKTKNLKKQVIITENVLEKIKIADIDKKRILNQIQNQNWANNYQSTKKIAIYFRMSNDFEIAKLINKINKSNPNKPEKEKQRTENIEKHIATINQNGILLFADTIPTDLNKYETNRHGVKYLDFRDKNALIEKYGYPKGTKVKDLKLLCHSSDNKDKYIKKLFKEDKDICISTILTDINDKFKTGIPRNNHYIITANNSNIIVCGKNIGSTGYMKDINYVKNMFFGKDNEERKYISEIIKDNLKLDNEEYAELYTKICDITDLSKIKDIKLQNNKLIKSNEIVSLINKIQTYLVTENEKPKYGYYKNEVVVYEPIVSAKVIEGNIDTIQASNLPIILI